MFPNLFCSLATYCLRVLLVFLLLISIHNNIYKRDKGFSSTLYYACMLVRVNVRTSPTQTSIYKFHPIHMYVSITTNVPVYVHIIYTNWYQQIQTTVSVIVGLTWPFLSWPTSYSHVSNTNFSFIVKNSVQPYYHEHEWF